jgi:hypothetical protein
MVCSVFLKEPLLTCSLTDRWFVFRLVGVFDKWRLLHHMQIFGASLVQATRIRYVCDLFKRNKNSKFKGSYWNSGVTVMWGTSSDIICTVRRRVCKIFEVRTELWQTKAYWKVIRPLHKYSSILQEYRVYVQT